MISVIIPVYKNKQEFLLNLKRNLGYLKNCEIIIVNDDPTESLEDDLKIYKDIQLLENSENSGFGKSVNRGVKRATGDFIMLLNSDVVLNDLSYKKALSHFHSDPKLFAVSFAQIEKNGETVGKNKIYWQKAVLNHTSAKDNTLGQTAWAEGGSSLIDRNKFIKLGGFEELYSPFYWEDVDLSYRAWKYGFSVLFDPEVVVTHHHGSTIKKYFKSNYTEYISYRNQFIFTWRNVTSPLLLFQNKLHLVPLVFRFLMHGNFAALKAFFSALFMLPKILHNKRNMWDDQERTDEEVLRLFS